MDDYEWKLTIETRRKGGPGSGNWGHAGRPGQVGGSAAGKVGEGQQTIRTSFTAAAQDAGLSEKQIARIKRMETAIPEGHMEGATVEFSRDIETLWSSWDNIVTGTYNPDTGEIRIHPKQGLNSLTIVHEVGHHVWHTRLSGADQSDVHSIWDRARDLNLSKDELGRMGLRDYSLTSRQEFFADFYNLGIYTRGGDRSFWNNFASHPEFRSFAWRMDRKLFDGELGLP